MKPSSSLLLLGLIFVTRSCGKNIEIISDYEGSGFVPAVMDHYSGEERENYLSFQYISFKVMNHNGDFM